MKRKSKKQRSPDHNRYIVLDDVVNITFRIKKNKKYNKCIKFNHTQLEKQKIRSRSPPIKT